MFSAPAIQTLLDELERLPGIGPKSAQRIAYWILNTDNDTALRLAEKYDFSGGQIENIARKVIIDQVLTGSDEIDPNKLFALCESEQFAKIIDRKPIGFAS